MNDIDTVVCEFCTSEVEAGTNGQPVKHDCPFSTGDTVWLPDGRLATIRYFFDIGTRAVVELDDGTSEYFRTETLGHA